MEEERDKAWNRFTSTGRVSDYLAYVADRESYRYGDCGSKEEKIVETAKRTDAKVAGPIPLPTKRRIYCVLRSPHKDKKSREHFEIRTHKRIIDIYEPTQQTTEELSRLDLPAGVDIEVKL